MCVCLQFISLYFSFVATFVVNTDIHSVGGKSRLAYLSVDEGGRTVTTAVEARFNDVSRPRLNSITAPRLSSTRRPRRP